ncbi:MAG: hybrid sensor histidine kinase/response regulator, partial [Acetatifactor sp.]|nr:hybrid sensor histidine kinase/response regulator [Acetatifactor sp.]
MQKIIYMVLLLIAVIVLFHWYTTQNRKRMEDRNKSYASDSAYHMAEHIDEKLNNALDLIKTYTFFIENSLTEPEISDEMLKEIKDNLLFDALVFTNTEGVNHISDGRTSDAAGKDYFVNAMQGKSGITVVYDSAFYDETMLCFYSPVRYNGEIIGVLRGAYLAEEYLKDMLST